MTEIDRARLLDGVAYADAWVAYRQQARDLPGVVVAIRSGTETVFAKGYGLADIETETPMTPGHVFRIASHSKTFTATAIMQLVEAGRLRLDDPLAQQVPWLRDQPALAGLTIRQALNHTAGITRDGADCDYWGLDRPFPDAAELRQLTEQDGAVLDANERFKYSNIGYSLLGLVVEAASGTPYNDYVRRNIVERLGLSDTGPETDPSVRSRLATGYTAPRLGLPRRALEDVPTGAMSPATGFYSTAEDLCRYGAAHTMGNTTLLSDASKREMQQPYWTVEQADEQYGLGLVVTCIGERRMVGHGGAFPGFSSRTLIDPRDQLVVVVLVNSCGPDGLAAPMAASIVKIINFALQQAPRGSAELERFTGRFVNLWGVSDVAAFGNRLVLLHPDLDDPVQRVTDLEVLDGDTLRMTSTNGYGSPGETVRYERDGDGQIQRVRIGGSSTYPLEVYRARLAAPVG
jgi:CubicO group peptidase (beta-lactamase class C family)